MSRGDPLLVDPPCARECCGRDGRAPGRGVNHRVELYALRHDVRFARPKLGAFVIDDRSNEAGIHQSSKGSEGIGSLHATIEEGFDQFTE